MDTAPVTTDRAAILADRWLMATTRPVREMDGLATVAIREENSKAVEAIWHGLETLAARLVQEVHEGDDLDSLAELIGGLIDSPIKKALLNWAEEHGAV